jgi:formamidopyrimidine-DNA glycosylase
MMTRHNEQEVFMPELPDVEVFRRYIDATSLHQAIQKVDCETSVLRHTSRPHMESLKGDSIDKTHRHGKHLFLELDGGKVLVMHFGMTGTIKYYRRPDHKPDHTHVEFVFEGGGHLAYVTVRKLGFVQLISDTSQYRRAQDLGADPLDDTFDKSRFLALFEQKRGGLKSALMDQSLIAGIGNVYSDEICFQAGIHPAVKVSGVSRQQMEELYRQMRRVFQIAIEYQVDSEEMPSNFLTSHRREGIPCPLCDQGSIKKETINGRSSYFCPSHQPR